MEKQGNNSPHLSVVRSSKNNWRPARERKEKYRKPRSILEGLHYTGRPKPNVKLRRRNNKNILLKLRSSLKRRSSRRSGEVTQGSRQGKVASKKELGITWNLITRHWSFYLFFCPSFGPVRSVRISSGRGFAVSRSRLSPLAAGLDRSYTIRRRDQLEFSGIRLRPAREWAQGLLNVSG